MHIVKFEKSLRALYSDIPLRCIVLLAAEFVQLDDGVLVKTGEKIVIADILLSSHFLSLFSRQVARMSCSAVKETLGSIVVGQCVCDSKREIVSLKFLM